MECPEERKERSECFDRKGMQALVDEFVQRIIHKPMPRQTGFSFEQGGGNSHPEMGAGAAAVRTGMTGVGSAFVQDFE